MFQLVLHHGVAVLQGISKVEMELTVIAVHLVTLLGIEFPDFLRLHNVEPARVFLVEVLHPGRMVEAFIVIRKHLIPAGGAAVLHRFQDQVVFYHLAGDLVIKPLQDALVDSGEDVACEQGFNLLLVKAGGQLQFLFHAAAEFQQSGMVLPVLPLMDHAVAVSLVGLREESLQSLEYTGAHGLGQGRQQHMGCKEAQRVFFLVLIACIFAYQLPESVDVAELFDVGNRCVGFLIQPVGEHGDKDILGRSAGDTGQDGHHIDVELDGCLVTAADFLQLTFALLVVQELGIEFDCLAHGGAGGHI